jgi:tetratricopeptide (TPR) repeat protein
MVEILARWQWERSYKAAREAMRAGQAAAAEKHARRSLRWAQHAGGQRQIMMAGSSVLLCAALRDQHRDNEAEGVAAAAVAELEKAGAITCHEHVRLTALTAELGRAQVTQGKLREATSTAERCEEHAEASQEKGYLGVSATLWSDLRLRQGRLSDAAEWLRRAKEYNSMRPAGTHLNLGTVYLSARRADLALEEYQAALREYQQTGASPLEFSMALMNLGSALCALGRDTEAEARHREALQYRNCGGAWGQLAVSLAKQGKSTEAERALVEATRNGEEESSLAYARGLLRLAQGRWMEAEAALQRAVRRKKSLYGERHPIVVDELEALVKAVEAQGRPEEAEPVRAEITKILESIGRL